MPGLTHHHQDDARTIVDAFIAYKNNLQQERQRERRGRGATVQCDNDANQANQRGIYITDQVPTNQFPNNCPTWNQDPLAIPSTLNQHQSNVPFVNWARPDIAVDHLPVTLAHVFTCCDYCQYYRMIISYLRNDQIHAIYNMIYSDVFQSDPYYYTVEFVHPDN